MNSRVRGSVEDQNEIGEHICGSLKTATKVDEVVKPTWRIPAFSSHSIDVILEVCKMLVRSEQEY